MGLILSPFSSICMCAVCQRDPNCDYEEGRRKVLKFCKHFTRKHDPEEVSVIDRYIEIPDGHVLFTRCFIPLKHKPKGCVFFIEGYATHLDLPDIYDGCLLLAKDGYLVVAHDHLGYGRSDGLWLHIPNSFDTDYVDNAYFIHNYYKHFFIKNLTSKEIHNPLYQYHDPALFNLADKRTAAVDGDDEKSESKQAEQVMPWTDLADIDKQNKYFLCGRSMGGAVATRLAMKYPDSYKGLILQCPMLEIDEAVKPTGLLKWVFEKLASWFPKQTWTPSGDINQWMLSDVRKKYLMDAQAMKFGRRPRLKTAFEMNGVTETIQRDMKLVKMDFIVLHGLADRVTNSQSSRNLYAHRKEECDATIKLYEESYHMMWWEDNPGEQLHNDVVEWLNEKCK
eukprot:CAMPEP_0197049040 /NCGR_PEP_ID=MMETSP1384-20130603/24272_1 /TAXON_ID=29189 /ORGANISM="Ammonia sp." /LENGTH=393 /DNA_ID=CAMNT_0042481265 /DNA_START=19 /DNA_END=1200 /DNA_ORIENTATION=-